MGSAVLLSGVVVGLVGCVVSLAISVINLDWRSTELDCRNRSLYFSWREGARVCLLVRFLLSLYVFYLSSASILNHFSLFSLSFSLSSLPTFPSPSYRGDVYVFASRNEFSITLAALAFFIFRRSSLFSSLRVEREKAMEGSFWKCC